MEKNLILVALIFSLLACRQESRNINSDIVFISDNSQSLVTIGNHLDNLDTSFSIESRLKESKYFFFYFVDGHISGSFIPDSSFRQVLESHLRSLNIYKVQKYEDENFYRITFRLLSKNIVCLLLSSVNTSFQYSSSSKLKNVAQSQTLNPDLDKYIYLLNNRIQVYIEK